MLDKPTDRLHLILMRQGALITVFLLALLSVSVKAGAPAPKPDTVVQDSMRAIDRRDMEALEGLRDRIRPQHIKPIVARWRKNLSWPVKDAYVALLMDQTGPLVKDIMEDALNSPTVESRAYAVCILRKDFKLFSGFLVKGRMNRAKVDAAVKEYRASK